MTGEKKKLPSFIKETGWTIEDYYQLPGDGNQYELVGGKLELKPSPSTTHQRVSHQIERVLSDSCPQIIMNEVLLNLS